jgi:hypothetical protein
MDHRPEDRGTRPGPGDYREQGYTPAHAVIAVCMSSRGRIDEATATGNPQGVTGEQIHGVAGFSAPAVQVADRAQRGQADAGAFRALRGGTRSGPA